MATRFIFGCPGITVSLTSYGLLFKALGLSLGAEEPPAVNAGSGRHHQAGGRAQDRRLIKKESVNRD